MYNSNTHVECAQVNYVILTSLCSGAVLSLFASNVHPAALATQALNEIPLRKGVRAVDTTLLIELSLVEFMSKYLRILAHFLWAFSTTFLSLIFNRQNLDPLSPLGLSSLNQSL